MTEEEMVQLIKKKAEELKPGVKLEGLEMFLSDKPKSTCVRTYYKNKIEVIFDYELYPGETFAKVTYWDVRLTK